MHKVALIVLYDAHQNILLQHRTEDAAFYPGYWAFFGGGCESGETPMEAVIRETLEELCHQLISPDFVMQQFFSVDELKCCMYLFAEQFDGDKNDLKLCEGQGWGWFGAGETDLLLMTDQDRKALQDARVFISEKAGSI